MLRVAVISVHACPIPDPQDSGGINIYLSKLCQELGRLGIELDIYTRIHDPSEPQVRELGQNARVVHIETGAGKSTDKELLFYYLPDFLRNLLCFTENNRLKYDLVHSHYWLSGWAGNHLKERWSVPHVASFHTLGQVKNKARSGINETDLRIAIEKEIVAGADRVVATSTAEESQLMRFYQVPPDKIAVIPCGVDLDLFHPVNKSRAKEELNLEDSKVALYVGRIDRVKGIDLLLEAVTHLEEKNGLRVILVGGGSKDGELDRLVKLKKKLRLGEQARFVGARDHRALPLYYGAADVCVVPSYYESFCMVALESLACGTPVIASRVGQLDAIVRHGENGYLIEGHCPEAFAERLELLLDNQALNRTFSTAARLSVERYSWCAVAERMAQLYREVSAASA